MFDYILTGPISGVSAGQYLGDLINELAGSWRHQRVYINMFAAGFGLLVTVYFWWINIKGVHESSGKALRIMQITTVMVAPADLVPHHHGASGQVKLPPAPVPSNLHFSDDAQGWLKGTFWLQFAMV